MNINNIKVSVLVPLYNVEQLLPRCLDSIIHQSLREIEIICVNDASPDTSLNIVEEFAKRDERIKIISHPINLGLMDSRKTGYKNANGEYVFFCDSDDFLPEYALEKLYYSAQETKSDITVGALYMINDQGRTTLRPRIGIEGAAGREYLRKILTGTTCSLCGTLFKRDLFTNYTYFSLKNQTFSEDRLLLTQILVKACPSINKISDVTYYYWVNTQSITRRKLSKDLLREQLNALFLSYDIVDGISDDLNKANKLFIIRYLTLYLEQLPWKNFIRNYNETSHKLLEFSELIKIAPVYLTIHTSLLLNIPCYRHLAWGARTTIRKLQGKV